MAQTDPFLVEYPPEVYVGDTVTGEFRPLHAFIFGNAPAELRDSWALAGEIVARMNEHRDSLPEYWDHDRGAFVYENGETA